MIHKVMGWFGGYVRVKLCGGNIERFINLCRNHGIYLWQLSWDTKQNTFLYVFLKDFYRLRPIGRKCHVHIVIEKKIGFPFFIAERRKHLSFWVGILCHITILLYLSTKLWGISVEGESYRTEESIKKYLYQENIYVGMDVDNIQPKKIAEKLRKKYEDIGWANVEKRGSKMIIYVKEVILVEKKKKETKGHLIADSNGRVISIVTRKGTARVKAGKKVKKGDVLISGCVKIYGDGEELLAKKYVHADGDVILEEKETYRDTLPVRYQKKYYTGRKKVFHEWNFWNKKFFYYNPLNQLESYEKYDIIRDGGVICPFLSSHFPVRHYKKIFEEIEYRNAVRKRDQAEKIFQERLQYYLSQKKHSGYQLIHCSVSLNTTEHEFEYSGTLSFRKKQNTYRGITKKNKSFDKETNTDGNNGNNN